MAPPQLSSAFAFGVVVAWCAAPVAAQERPDAGSSTHDPDRKLRHRDDGKDGRHGKDGKRGRGLRARTDAAMPGYTLISPLHTKTIHLVDLDGRVVHEWRTGFNNGTEVFLDDGRLLRCAKEPGFAHFDTGGQCGRIQELDWDGTVVWDFVYAAERRIQHHDFELLPNGNVLLIAREVKTRQEAIEAGRDPAGVAHDGLWVDFLIEVEPQRPRGGTVVWEWRVWDHLIQDHDRDAENYGDVAANPQRIDLNADLRAEAVRESELEEMKQLGYVGGEVKRAEITADWLHLNSVDYDAEHDQIAIVTPRLSEIWLLDHSTTSAEAAGETGGRSGRGGGLLWRWGNPQSFRAGGLKEQQLFGPHDVRFLRPGLPGAGHLLVFNNGGRRPDGSWSSVLELELPRGADGAFAHDPGLPFPPSDPSWSYAAPVKTDFFSGFVSGATRLANGNTLICEGSKGRVFEVTPSGEICWDYLNPFTDRRKDDGASRRGGPRFALFRASRIPADHPALRGKDLTPKER